MLETMSLLVRVSFGPESYFEITGFSGSGTRQWHSQQWQSGGVHSTSCMQLEHVHRRCE